MLVRCLPSRRSRGYTLLALFFTLLPGAPALAGPYTDAGHPVSSMGAWATAVDELVLQGGAANDILVEPYQGPLGFGRDPQGAGCPARD